MGFSVASLPGPIIILIATETLRKGAGAGMLTMTAPLLIDALVMLPLALLLQASLVSGKGWVGLGFVGACLLAWLGWQSMRGSGRGAETDPGSGWTGWSGRRKELPSFLKGVLTHLTNPYPYIYWATVGVVFVRQGLEQDGALGALVFPLGFWLGASTMNLVVVYLAVRGRQLLSSQWTPYLHRFSGILLIGSAMLVAFKAWGGPFLTDLFLREEMARPLLRSFLERVLASGAVSFFASSQRASISSKELSAKVFPFCRIFCSM